MIFITQKIKRGFSFFELRVNQILKTTARDKILNEIIEYVYLKILNKCSIISVRVVYNY